MVCDCISLGKLIQALYVREGVREEEKNVKTLVYYQAPQAVDYLVKIKKHQESLLHVFAPRGQHLGRLIVSCPGRWPQL